jgi:hypothetical protein
MVRSKANYRRIRGPKGTENWLARVALSCLVSIPLADVLRLPVVALGIWSTARRGAIPCRSVCSTPVDPQPPKLRKALQFPLAAVMKERGKEER